MKTLASMILAGLSICSCLPDQTPPDGARPCGTPVDYEVESPDPTYTGPVWLDADGRIVAQVQSETDTTAVYVECMPNASIVAWFDSLDD